MPIKRETYSSQGQLVNVQVDYPFMTFEVRHGREHRNVSDTLDQSDYQTVDVTYALVYAGRQAESNIHRRSDAAPGLGWPHGCYKKGEELAPIDRFVEVDCTNTFVWRGADKLVPSVDDVKDPQALMDYFEFTVAREALMKKRAEQAEAARQKRDEEEREKARNLPVKGKRMVVASGRKVPVGTQGTVAFVRDDGRVLLKPDAVWQDRKADGVWVEARHLKAR